ncbi:MAG: hypothetical protein ABIZ34_09080 [Candidatus Limnocylindrales bacterium]
MSFFPILLVAHIVCAVSLFLPSVLLPFALHVRKYQDAALTRQRTHGGVVRGLLWLQSNGTLVLGAGAALTGLALVFVLGTDLITTPWLLAALMIYAADLGVAFFIQRPGLRSLIGIRSDASDADQDRWRIIARRQRYVSYGMAAAIGAIAVLMSTKPGA